eukprot:1828866-Rhodomonas_salina.2
MIVKPGWGSMVLWLVTVASDSGCRSAALLVHAEALHCLFPHYASRPTTCDEMAEKQDKLAEELWAQFVQENPEKANDLSADVDPGYFSGLDDW